MGRELRRANDHLVISDSRLDYRMVRALPDGGYGYLPHHNRMTSEYLAVALPLGLPLRRCEELRHPHQDPSAAPRAERIRPDHPSDIWTLRAGCPAAFQAAYNGNPLLILWHFQLAS